MRNLKYGISHWRLKLAMPMGVPRGCGMNVEAALSTVPKPPYRRAPIIEAVIHLHVAGAATAEDQKKLCNRLAEDYPHVQELAEVSVTLDTTGGAAAVQQQSSGFRLTSNDEADVVVISQNGIVTARLAPYSEWGQLRDRAAKAWSEWRRVSSARNLDRLGIRYINRIDIPMRGVPTVAFGDYIRFHPLVPTLGPGALTGFLIQATSPTDNPLWTASLTSSIVSPPPIIEHLSLLLDIDIFRTKDIPGREEDLWMIIDEARRIKNRIFEICVTDKSRELFG